METLHRAGHIPATGLCTSSWGGEEGGEGGGEKSRKGRGREGWEGGSTGEGRGASKIKEGA